MNCNDFRLGSNPKKNINIKNGIKERSKLIKDEAIAEIGKMMVGTLMDLRTPARATTEVKT